VPKAPADSLLTATVRPTLNRRTQSLEAAEKDISNGAILWDVNITEFSARFAVQPDDWPEPGDKAREPDPHIEADFTIIQLESVLAVVKWSITGTEVISTRKSRIPLQSYARAALIAVEDALEANGYYSYKEMTAERRGHVSAYQMNNGRLLDPETRQPRKPPSRKHVYPPSGIHRLDLARIADTYRKAVKAGSRSATLDTARAFNISRSTAARKITEARRQGLLGPARRNAAGELGTVEPT